jgi:hypothetical protein
MPSGDKPTQGEASRRCEATRGLCTSLAGLDGHEMSINKKIRYVLGLFTRIGDLERALEELGSDPVAAGRLKVIAPTTACDGIGVEWQKSGRSHGFETWIAAERKGRCTLQLLSPQSDRTVDEAESRLLAGFHTWALARHAQQLERHLRTGGGILVVRSDTEAEERAACATLLRYATAGVQTHEVNQDKLN